MIKVGRLNKKPCPFGNVYTCGIIFKTELDCIDRSCLSMRDLLTHGSYDALTLPTA